MIVKLYADDGRCLFAGAVTDDAVELHRPPNLPATLIVKRPVVDALAQLGQRVQPAAEDAGKQRKGKGSSVR